MSSLGETLYNVYEAKKYAERVRSVGDATYMLVLNQDGSADLMGHKGFAILEGYFREFGPRPTKDFQLPGDIYHRIKGFPKPGEDGDE